MSNQESRFNGSHEENGNTTNNPNKARLLAAGAVLAGAATAAAILGHESGSAPNTDTQDTQIAIMAEQIGLDANVAQQLDALRAANEGAPGPHEIPASVSEVLSVGDFTVDSNLIDGAINAYKENNHMADSDAIPESVSESITFTAQREEQENGHPQPGQEYGLVILRFEDGNDYGVVSGPLQHDPN